VFNATFNNISLISWRENRNIGLNFLLNGSTKILECYHGSKIEPSNTIDCGLLKCNDFKKGSCYSIFSFLCMFCRSLFVLLSFFFWPLHCLFFYDLRLLITLLILLKITNNILNQGRSKSLDWTAYKQINF
jgi:hypothetical protein